MEYRNAGVEAEAKRLKSNASRTARIMFRLFPTMLNNQAEQSIADKQEVQRRAELGQHGRILEDAANSIRFSALGNHFRGPNSTSSYARPRSWIIDELDVDEDGIFGRIWGDHFGFTFGVGKSSGPDIDIDEVTGMRKVYLVGYGPDRQSVIDWQLLDSSYLASLSQSDLDDLEEVAVDILRVSKATAIVTRYRQLTS